MNFQSVQHEKKLQQEARKKQEVKLVAALAETEEEGDTVCRSAYLELQQLDAANQELVKARMALKRRVFSGASTSTEVPLVTEVAYADLKRKLVQLEHEREAIQSANMSLQKALAAKILSSEELDTLRSANMMLQRALASKVLNAGEWKRA